jgi:hypothetical protein
MSSYAIRGFMGWLSNTVFIQYLSSNRSFFIAFDQYFLVFTPFDICAAPKLRAMSVRNLMKGLSGVLTPIQKSVFGAIERINKGKKATYDSFGLILFEMLHGGEIFKNGDFSLL